MSRGGDPSPEYQSAFTGDCVGPLGHVEFRPRHPDDIRPLATLRQASPRRYSLPRARAAFFLVNLPRFYDTFTALQAVWPRRIRRFGVAFRATCPCLTAKVKVGWPVGL